MIEMLASHLIPGDRLRRGRDVFTVGRVDVTIDSVVAFATLAGKADPISIRLAPGEIVRLEDAPSRAPAAPVERVLL